MSDQLQMTDGMHIIVEALKQNNIDTIYIYLYLYSIEF